MNTQSLNVRLAATAASVAITFSLLGTLAGMAKPPVGAPLLAQAAVTTAVR